MAEVIHGIADEADEINEKPQDNEKLQDLRRLLLGPGGLTAQDLHKLFLWDSKVLSDPLGSRTGASSTTAWPCKKSSGSTA